MMMVLALVMKMRYYIRVCGAGGVCGKLINKQQFRAVQIGKVMRHVTSRHITSHHIMLH